jgi:predicted nucleic acid-binding protein
VGSKRTLHEGYAVKVYFDLRNDNIARRAFELEKNGIMGMDALHVACAEESGADYFVSCDDVLVRRLNKIEDIKVLAVGLLEFISREVF